MAQVNKIPQPQFHLLPPFPSLSLFLSPPKVEFCDTVVMSKSDLVPAASLARLEATVKALNPGARILRSGFTSSNGGGSGGSGGSSGALGMRGATGRVGAGGRGSGASLLPPSPGLPSFENLVGVGRFDFATAEANPGWLRTMRGEDHGATAGLPPPPLAQFWSHECVLGEALLQSLYLRRHPRPRRCCQATDTDGAFARLPSRPPLSHTYTFLTASPSPFTLGCYGGRQAPRRRSSTAWGPSTSPPGGPFTRVAYGTSSSHWWTAAAPS